MKKSQLRQIIKEEISKLLKENEAFPHYDKPASSFRVKKKMEYDNGFLHPGLYKLKKSSGGKHVYWNQAFQAEVTMDDMDLYNLDSMGDLSGGAEGSNVIVNESE